MNDSVTRSARIGLVVALAAFCASACSSAPKESPEDQIRALIAKGEKAAEEKDLGTLKDLLSDAYKDEEGNRKAEITKILAYHLMSNASVHLLTTRTRHHVPRSQERKATVFVAMAGGELSSIADRCVTAPTSIASTSPPPRKGVRTGRSPARSGTPRTPTTSSEEEKRNHG
jgi:hypothetical protein